MFQARNMSRGATEPPITAFRILSTSPEDRTPLTTLETPWKTMHATRGFRRQADDTRLCYVLQERMHGSHPSCNTPDSDFLFRLY